jgi:low temperature requirement protein LtrA
MNGLLLLINPEFAAHRWAWELNPLDARMVSAWFLGWSAWCGTMAFAQDWDEIRTATRLFILNGVALLAVTVVFRDELIPGRGTGTGFAVALAVMTGIMIAFNVLQDRRRPIDQPAPAELTGVGR